MKDLVAANISSFSYLLTQDKIKSKLIFVGFVLGLLVSSCGENKLSQCEQIYYIAQGVEQNSNDVSYSDDDQPEEMKIWLESAGMLNKAADKIQALHINDSQLIGYQNQLATIYRIYSQATYDAVKAREGKNIEALTMAQEHAAKAGEMQRSLITEVNAYCVQE